MSMTDQASKAPAFPPGRMHDDAFVLMVIVAVLFALLLLALLFVALPTSNKDVVLALAGVLASSFSTVVGFYFGSSRSSQAKDATITSLTSKPSP
jgi:uncharacterized RDD family membrane protein YckC